MLDEALIWFANAILRTPPVPPSCVLRRHQHIEERTFCRVLCFTGGIRVRFLSMHNIHMIQTLSHASLRLSYQIDFNRIKVFIFTEQYMERISSERSTLLYGFMSEPLCCCLHIIGLKPPNSHHFRRPAVMSLLCASRQLHSFGLTLTLIRRNTRI